MKLVTTNIEQLTLSTHFIEFEAPNGKVIVDIKKLLDGKGDEAYFNATQIAKMFEYENKKGTLVDGSQILKNYLKNKSTKEYMKAIEEAYSPLSIKYSYRGYTGNNSKINGTWLNVYILDNFLMTILDPTTYVKLKATGKLDFHKKEVVKSSVYVLVCSDSTIKIGISADVKARLNAIKNQSGKTIVDFVVTDKLDQSYKIEQFLLAYFDDYRINGEWLEGVKYQIVVDKLLSIINRTYLNDTILQDKNINLIGA